MTPKQELKKLNKYNAGFIKSLRIENKISQAEVAEWLGLHQSVISRIESNHREITLAEYWQFLRLITQK